MTSTGLAGGTLWDRSTRGFVEGNYTKGVHVFQARMALFRDFIRYEDMTQLTDDTGNSRTLTSQVEWAVKLKKVRWMTGVDVQNITANAEAYPYAIQCIYPAQLAAFGVQVKRWSLGANARMDWYEKIPVYAGFAAWNWKGLSVKFSGGKTFRRPALNDLYWARNGNPMLTAETGEMGEVSLGWSADKKRISWKFSTRT